jgi:hypothetical protein
MLHGFRIGPLSERLLRGPAVFFLLFTFADVAFPPPCSEMNDGLSAARQVSAQGRGGDVSDHSKAVGSNDSRSDQSPERGCCDEDCCFGCAHVLPTVAFTEVAVFDMESTSVVTVDQFMPEPPLRGTYHPPRFV